MKYTITIKHQPEYSFAKYLASMEIDTEIGYVCEAAETAEAAEAKLIETIKARMQTQRDIIKEIEI